MILFTITILTFLLILYFWIKEVIYLVHNWNYMSEDKSKYKASRSEHIVIISLSLLYYINLYLWFILHRWIDHLIEIHFIEEWIWPILILWNLVAVMLVSHLRRERLYLIKNKKW
jgi:hypothetical protein